MTDTQTKVMTHACLQYFPRHWLFCSEATSHSSDIVKGLADHLHYKRHRALFVLKGNDAIKSFLWTGQGDRGMTAAGGHVERWALSSGSDMWLITTATAGDVINVRAQDF